jgi:hypothetical protein
MHLGRICLFLAILGAIRVTLTGVGDEGLLIAVVGFALCLGLLDRRVQRSNQTATCNQVRRTAEPEEPDEGRG